MFFLISLLKSCQFDLLFNDIHFLKNAAVNGSLENTNLRCITWMIFLECIPFDKNLWLSELIKHRNVYERIKHELFINPHDKCCDHPLCQDENVKIIDLRLMLIKYLNLIPLIFTRVIGIFISQIMKLSN
jgi:hypothetical protein